MNRRQAAAIATLLAVIATAVLLWEGAPPAAPVVDIGVLPLRGINAGAEAGSGAALDRAATGRRNEVEGVRSFRVRVMCDGMPVGAAACLASSGLLEARAVTDELGRAELQFSAVAAGACALQVQATGYSTAILWLREPWGRVVEVSVGAGVDVIRGLVRRSPARALPSELQVVAWPQSMPDVASLIAAGGGFRTNIDSDGSFELRGLPPNRAYSLGVSAPGWTTRMIRQVALPVPPGEAPVDLVACRIYATLLQAREVDGSTPPASTFGGIGYSSDATGFYPIGGTQPVTWALAGLLPEASHADPERSWFDYLLGFLGDGEGLGARASLTYLVPGFVEAQAIVDINAIAGSLPVKQVALQRLPVELVDVEIHCTHPCGLSGAQLKGRPPYELKFVEASAGSAKIWQRWEASFDSRTVRGVPAAEFEVSLFHSGSVTKLIPREGVRVRFGPGQPNRLTFDTSGYATLRVVGSGPRFDDEPRRINVGGAKYEFLVGPYVLGGLKAGRQKIQCGTFEQEVDLVAGATTTLTLAEVR